MRKLILSIWSLLLSAGIQAGDRISIHFHPLLEQLPSNSVQRLYQDRNGFLWLGTSDGLCRYDAYDVLVFRSNPEMQNLLNNNTVTCLTEDKNNHLLIGTQQGLNIMDLDTYHISPLGSETASEEEICSIHVTADSSIWVGTSTRLHRYGADYTLKKTYSQCLPSAQANSLYEDNQGNLWVMLWNKGIHKYDPETDSFISYPSFGKNNNPFRMYQDSDGVFWLCTWNDGMYIFNPVSDENRMYTPFIVNSQAKDSEMNFFSITQDNTMGYVWIMSNLGLHAFRRAGTGEITQVDISHLFRESNNIFSEIIKDPSGNLWVGTFDEGLISIEFNKPVMENYTFPEIRRRSGFTPNIAPIFKDEAGVFWLNQNRWGLFFYHPENGKITHYKEIPLLKNKHEMSVSCISVFRSMPQTVAS